MIVVAFSVDNVVDRFSDPPQRNKYGSLLNVDASIEHMINVEHGFLSTFSVLFIIIINSLLSFLYLNIYFCCAFDISGLVV